MGGAKPLCGSVSPQTNPYMRLSMRKVFVFAVVAALFASAAFAQSGHPAAKATAAVNKLIGLNAYSNAALSDTGWVTVLSQTIKTANQKDLFVDVSFECGIWTDTKVTSSGGTVDTATAQAGVRVRVLVDGNPISPAEGNAIDESGNLSSAQGVSFCSRLQKLTAKFQGIFADLEDTGCFDGDPNTLCELLDEEIELVLSTLDANSFNFVAADVSSGVHTVEVQARALAGPQSSTGTGEVAAGKAIIGAGSVTIEEVRMIRGEQVEFE